MPLIAKPLAELPKRSAPPTREYDKEAAAAALAIVSTDGATATDGEVYADKVAARKEASKTARLLGHVRPDGKSIKSRVYALEDASGFAWAVWMIDTPTPPAPAAKAK
jgi:hypothetical protein